MNKIKEKIGIFEIIVLFSLIYYEISSITRIFSGELIFSTQIILIINIGLFFKILTDFARKKIKINSVGSILLLFSINAIISTIIYYYNYSTNHLLIMCSQSCLWANVIYYFSTKESEKIEKYAKLFCILSIIHIFLYLIVDEFISNNLDFFHFKMISYFNLFCLPFIMCIKNSKIRNIMLIINFIPILISGKRTGTIIYVIAILIFMLFQNKEKNFSKEVMKKLRVGIAILIFVLSFMFIIDVYELDILERIGNISEDGGSGRDVVFEHTLDMIISQKNVVNILFGNGFNTVVLDSKLELSAHNDYLEVVYDYGILGLILIIALLIKMLLISLEFRKNNIEGSNILLSTIVIVVAFMMSSHLIIYPTYFIYLCIFWGLIISKYESLKNKKIQIKENINTNKIKVGENNE